LRTGNDVKIEGISTVITNFNGSSIIGECIEAVQKAGSKIDLTIEIIVVDDCSEDDSVNFIRSNFSEVQLLALDENVGYGEANNRGIHAANHELILVLNSDMFLTEDFFKNFQQSFDDENVFAVACNILSPDTMQHEGGCCGLTNYHHFISSVEETAAVAERTDITSNPGGGMIMRKSIFEKLGGYSPIYSPYYWEDLDLGLRAWRSGYRVGFNPNAKVLHKHQEGSISKNTEAKKIELIKIRNQYLFLWRHTSAFKSLLALRSNLPGNRT